MLPSVAKDWIARLVNHVSELVVEMERVDWSHETSGARARDGNRFFAHSTWKVTSGWQGKQPLNLRTVSSE